MLKYTKEFLEPLVKKHISLNDIIRELGLKTNGGLNSHIGRLVRKYGLDTSHFTYGRDIRKYGHIKASKEELIDACKNNVSIAGVLRHLGFSASGKPFRDIAVLIEEYKIDISHFSGQGWNKGLKMPIGKGNKKDPRDILVLREESDYRFQGQRLKKALIELGRPDICEYCGQEPFWKGKPLVLEVDHKNGKFWDNREENLAISCPNCHSQLPTFGIRNVYTRVSEQADELRLERSA